jgi:hypothetical protein
MQQDSSHKIDFKRIGGIKIIPGPLGGAFIHASNPKGAERERKSRA